MPKLPQARMRLDFAQWIKESLVLDHGWKIHDAYPASIQAVRDFLEDNNIAVYPDDRFDFSRPSAMEIKNEYILRDG